MRLARPTGVNEGAQESKQVLLDTCVVFFDGRNSVNVNKLGHLEGGQESAEKSRAQGGLF